MSLGLIALEQRIDGGRELLQLGRGLRGERRGRGERHRHG
jgi:hypothetical protein